MTGHKVSAETQWTSMKSSGKIHVEEDTTVGI